MRTIEKKIYTIDELKEVSASGYEKAIEAVSEQRQNNFYEFYALEIVNTLEKACEHFHMNLAYHSYGLYEGCFTRVGIEEYFDLSNAEKNYLVKWLNDNMQDGKDGSCPFTGVCYDSYFFDSIIEQVGLNGATYNNLHVIVPEAIDDCLRKAVTDEQNSIFNDEDCHNYAKDMELEFTEEGKIFY